MKHLGNLTLTITEDYCHLEVIELFKKLHQNNNLKLFAITSDIDNLGEYISYNGRAKGQNLVDYYTNIISEFIFYTLEQNVITDLVFIPAGEEVSIFGLCTNENEFDRFIADLDSFVSRKIQEAKLNTGLTGIKFGGKVIDEKHILCFIEEFINKLSNDTNYKPFEDYYRILEEIRTVVSPLVDREKFKSLGISEVEDIIMLRNIIYNELLEYKKNTKELLQIVSHNMNSLEAVEVLSKKYGLDEEKINRISEIKIKILTLVSG